MWLTPHLCLINDASVSHWLIQFSKSLLWLGKVSIWYFRLHLFSRAEGHRLQLLVLISYWFIWFSTLFIIASSNFYLYDTQMVIISLDFCLFWSISFRFQLFCFFFKLMTVFFLFRDLSFYSELQFEKNCMGKIIHHS